MSTTTELTADELRSYIGQPYSNLPEIACAEHYPLVEMVDGVQMITGVLNAYEMHGFDIVDDMYAVPSTPTTPEIIVNWSTLDQALLNEDEAGQEAFVAEGRKFAAEKGLGFDTIRNIQKPAFVISTDGGETQSDEYGFESESYFEQICARIV